MGPFDQKSRRDGVLEPVSGRADRDLGPLCGHKPRLMVDMPSLPIPLISSIFLAFLMIRVWSQDRRAAPLVLLLAACALQGLIISLAQHYGVPGMGVVQALFATVIPPLAWVAFRTTAVQRFALPQALHAAGPVLGILCLAVYPPSLDVLIPALFVLYGAALVRTGFLGPDALPRMRLAAGDLPRRTWQVIGAALVGSAVSDVLIVAARLAGHADLQAWIISIFSSGMLLVVGALAMSSDLANHDDADDPAAPTNPEQSDEDRALMHRLETLMTKQRPYLDPDLTLSQLARKLTVPVKDLSGAINRVTGENVSRYVNAARIKAAQDAMMAGENVTSAMLGSGFNTKSNFNREFLRISGQSPTEWRAGSGA